MNLVKKKKKKEKVTGKLRYGGGTEAEMSVQDQQHCRFFFGFYLESLNI